VKQSKQIVLAVVGGVAVFAALLASLWAFAVYVPQNSQTTRSVMVQIRPGESIAEIGQTLRQEDLVSSSFIFTLYARLSGQGDRLIPGTYELKGSMNMPQIIEYLAGGKVAARKVVVPEGFTVAKISRLWNQAGFGASQEFVAAASKQYDYAFLPKPNKDVKYQVEGYLFPATYQVSVNATSESFIRQMLEAFEAQAVPVISSANNGQLSSLADVVNLASIVELEANDAANRAKVAQVFLNRLEQNIALQSDVTVNYATGKSNTAAADIVFKSPYNTYVVKALPPGPICSPGLESIKAVLNPTKTDDIFFLAGRDGQVYYAKTLVEHNKNIDRYLK
jgi:UPF0755 protein